MVRQLFELKVGSRRGVMSRFMRPVVADLSTLDMLNIAAYVASLPPPPPRESTSMQSASR
jgi:cytochrome c553